MSDKMESQRVAPEKFSYGQDVYFIENGQLVPGFYICQFGLRNRGETAFALVRRNPKELDPNAVRTSVEQLHALSEGDHIMTPVDPTALQQEGERLQPVFISDSLDKTVFDAVNGTTLEPLRHKLEIIGRCGELAAPLKDFVAKKTVETNDCFVAITQFIFQGIRTISSRILGRETDLAPGENLWRYGTRIIDEIKSAYIEASRTIDSRTLELQINLMSPSAASIADAFDRSVMRAGLSSAAQIKEELTNKYPEAIEKVASDIGTVLAAYRSLQSAQPRP